MARECGSNPPFYAGFEASMWENGSAPEGAGNTAPRLDLHHLDERKC